MLGLITYCSSNLCIHAVLAFLCFIKHIFIPIPYKENFKMARITDSNNSITIENSTGKYTAANQTVSLAILTACFICDRYCIVNPLVKI